MNKPFKQLTAYIDDTPVVASNSSQMLEESKVKTAKFTQKEIDLADNYLASLSRNDMFPVRPAIGEAFIEGIRTSDDHITKLEARNKELEEALGLTESWPITDVLLKLVESTEYLLNVKNYDKQGWEEVSYCAKLGRQYIDKINSVIAEQALNNRK